MAMPLRRCRVCRTQRPKAELDRWVKAETGLVLDPTQRQPGRGYYSCLGNDHCREILPRTLKGKSK